jgi:hypothetical protein
VLLADLRDARFTPGGWACFFRDSFARAREQRTARPRAHRQAIAAGAAGIAAWGAVAAAGHPVLAVTGAAWWLAAVLMLEVHLGLLETPDGRRLDRIGVPNALSLLRAGAIPLLPALPPHALAWALVAGAVTDVLDGALARSRRSVTRLGLWLDGTVDGVLLGVAAASLAAAGRLPWWCASLVLARFALPWLSAPIWLARAETPRPGEYVPGRIPGALLLAGLVASGLAIPGAAVAAAVGALAGIGTFSLTMLSSGSRRPPSVSSSDNGDRYG